MNDLPEMADGQSPWPKNRMLCHHRFCKRWKPLKGAVTLSSADAPYVKHAPQVPIRICGDCNQRRLEGKPPAKEVRCWRCDGYGVCVWRVSWGYVCAHCVQFVKGRPCGACLGNRTVKIDKADRPLVGRYIYRPCEQCKGKGWTE